MRDSLMVENDAMQLEMIQGLFLLVTIAFLTGHSVARYVRSLHRGTVEILEYVFTL